MYIKLVYFLFLLLVYKLSFATTFVVPADGDVVGEIQYAYAQTGESIGEVGLRYDVGYNEMVRANPNVNPAMALPPHARLLIPSQYILPNVARAGIVINLAEYRLYYFPPNDNVVITQPVGIGRKGWNTPVGITRVIAKQRDPVWRPSAKLRAEAEKNGLLLPEVFPANSGNPLGRHSLRLGWPTYLIHGTNKTDGVGMRVSAGCIRMLPEDIEYLYELVKVGTAVRVINQPLKLGKLDGEIYLEAHAKLINDSSLSGLAQKQLSALQQAHLNKMAIKQELNFPSGIPKKISS